MQKVMVCFVCSVAVVFFAGCGRRAPEPGDPVRRVERMPEIEYETSIPDDEFPAPVDDFEMPEHAFEEPILDDDPGDAPFPFDDHDPQDIPADQEPEDETETDEAEQVKDPRTELANMGIFYHKWAFIEAAGKGNAEAVRLFIKAGMEVDVINAPAYGETALIWAARGGHADVVELLVENGAEVNRRNAKDMTALGYALMFKHSAAAEVLRKAGGVR